MDILLLLLTLCGYSHTWSVGSVPKNALIKKKLSRIFFSFEKIVDMTLVHKQSHLLVSWLPFSQPDTKSENQLRPQTEIEKLHFMCVTSSHDWLHF